MENNPRHIRYLKAALKEASKSDYRHQMGAVAVKGGRILSKGFNSVRYKSTGVSKYSLWKESLHAERHCISKLRIEDIKGMTLYVAREYKNGNFSLAKPCDSCAYMLKDLGVKRVIFSIPEEPFYEEVRL